MNKPPSFNQVSNINKLTPPITPPTIGIQKNKGKAANFKTNDNTTTKKTNEKNNLTLLILIK